MQKTLDQLKVKYCWNMQVKLINREIFDQFHLQVFSCLTKNHFRFEINVWYSLKQIKNSFYLHFKKNLYFLNYSILKSLHSHFYLIQINQDFSLIIYFFIIYPFQTFLIINYYAPFFDSYQDQLTAQQQIYFMYSYLFNGQFKIGCYNYDFKLMDFKIKYINSQILLFNV